MSKSDVAAPTATAKSAASKRKAARVTNRVAAPRTTGKTRPPVAVRDTNVVSIALGRSLKTWRIERELSQEQLAGKAAVDPTFIGRIERGVTNPTVFVLSHLCAALDITLSDLFAPVKQNLPPPVEGADVGFARRANAAKPKHIEAPKRRLR